MNYMFPRKHWKVYVHHSLWCGAFPVNLINQIAFYLFNLTSHQAINKKWKWNALQRGWSVAQELFESLLNFFGCKAARSNDAIHICDLREGAVHTWYLSFFVCHCIFWPVNCKPEKCVNLRQKFASRQNSINQYWSYLLFWLAYLLFWLAHLVSFALGWCICYMRSSTQNLG